MIKPSSEFASEIIPNAQGVSKTVLISSGDAPHFAMRKFTIQPGGAMPYHYNLVEHEQYVLAGHALVTIDGQDNEVRAGDVVFIPAEVPHSYRNLGEEEFVFLCMVPNQHDETILA